MGDHHHHHHANVDVQPNAGVDDAIGTIGDALQNGNGSLWEKFQSINWTNTAKNIINQSADSSSTTTKEHGMEHGMKNGIEHGMEHGVDHSQHNAQTEHGSHNMATYFYFGFENVQMLFKKWIISDIKSLLFACIILLVICIFAEWLRVWRENKSTAMICALQQQWRRSEASSPRNSTSRYGIGHHVVNSRTEESLLNQKETQPDMEEGGGVVYCETVELRPIAPRLLVGLKMKNHILLSIGYTIQQFISLFLMLVFMTFNLYLCLTIAIGHGLGYYLFSWKRLIYGSIGKAGLNAAPEVSGSCH
jgi:copper transporter 1